MATGLSKDFPRLEVRPHGSPALCIGGRPTFPLLLMTSSSALCDLQAIAPNAIHLLTEVFPLGWEGIGRHDFTAFDLAVRTFLAADPQAMLLPCVHLDAPADWLETHPGDVHAADDGDMHICAPRSMRWVEARSGRTLAAAATEITVRMSRGQTLLLEVDPA